MTSVEEARKRAERDAARSRMHLCPDPKMLHDLLEGLVENEKRYGYPSCPCRIASGELEKDVDIICPCYYRDPDVEEFGQCYCSLYVSEAVYEGKEPIRSIPERRPVDKQAFPVGIEAEEDVKQPKKEERVEIQSTERKLIYCKQCGYVIYREEPPYRCPICQAKKEMFAQLVLTSELKPIEFF